MLRRFLDAQGRTINFNLVDHCQSTGVECQPRRHARRRYTSKYYKGNASIMDQNSCGRLRHWRNASLLHATKDALFVLVTATSGTSVILFVVSNAVLTLLHLDISVVDLVTSVALRVTGLLAWSQSTARKVLAQVSGRNMRYWRSILGEGDWNAPWSPSTAEAAR